MTSVWLNRIGTAVPAHDVHRKFVEFAPALLRDERERRMFARLAEKAQIEHRFSIFEPSPDPALLDAGEFYVKGCFPGTAARMAMFEKHALPLAVNAAREALSDVDRNTITHLIVATCTGFSAPGLDLQLAHELGLRPYVERTVIGFMGCFAAITGLKAASHIVRSDPGARVLLVNLELSTLHLQEGADLEGVLGFMQFGDGCAASVISAEARGLKLGQFHCNVMHDAAQLITWMVGDHGFAMHLSPSVPGVLGESIVRMLQPFATTSTMAATGMWAVHPGGRAILDAVESGLSLRPGALAGSRRVLRDFGNMSSATVMFVLRDLLADSEARGNGLAMAFGPGLSLESMTFEKP